MDHLAAAARSSNGHGLEGAVAFPRRLLAEGIGTALLLAIVVGSGIMGERLAGGNVALALLANTVATGAGLVALILTFGSVSAHFNPAVSVAEAARGALAWREVPAYVAAQAIGAFAGVVVAHVMFGEPMLSASVHVRAGTGQLVGEFVATFGLVTVVRGCGHGQPSAVAFGMFPCAPASASRAASAPALVGTKLLADVLVEKEGAN